MSPDKQLSKVRLEDVVEKRRLDQALTTKEFAVLAGISYSTARMWFRLPGFPSFHGRVFWKDFFQWRSAQSCLTEGGEISSQGERQNPTKEAALRGNSALPARAARILAEV